MGSGSGVRVCMPWTTNAQTKTPAAAVVRSRSAAKPLGSSTSATALPRLWTLGSTRIAALIARRAKQLRADQQAADE